MRLFACCLLVLTLLPCFGQSPEAPSYAAGGGITQGRPGYGPLADSPPRGTTHPVDPGDFSAWGGKVALDSGGPPPAGTPIDMRCGAKVKRVAYSRADGKFVYREDSTDADARSYSTRNSSFANLPFNNIWAPGTAEANTEDCQVRAVLKGYTSSVAFPYRDRQFRPASYEVTIFLHKAGSGPAGSPVSQAAPPPDARNESDKGMAALGQGNTESGDADSPVSQATPPDAHKTFEQGMAALGQGNTQEALQNFRKAVETCPTYAEAWYELGRLEAKQGRVQQAKEDFSRALGADPKYVQPYLELSQSLAGS